MPGFYVSNGVLMHQGSPVKELGLNCPDLLLRWLANLNASLAPSAGDPLQYQTSTTAATFDLMKSYGFRVVRFSVFGNRPLIFQRAWIEGQAAHIAALDALFDLADAKGMLLIPSLFFSPPQIPNYYGEHLKALGIGASQTRLMCKSIIENLVARYKNRASLAMWEMGNEYDGAIGNAGQFTGPQDALPTNGFSLNTSLGDPAAWVFPDDSCTVETVYNFANAFQSDVKRIDSAPAFGAKGPSRATTSGNQGYRNRAISQKFSAFMVDRIADDKSDTLCFHTYQLWANGAYYNSDYLGYESMLRNALQYAKNAGKPLILGEFGIPRNYNVGRLYSQQQQRVTAAIVGSGIQLAMLWTFPGVVGTDPTAINGVGTISNTSFRPDEVLGNRGAELTAMAELNRMFQAT